MRFSVLAEFFCGFAVLDDFFFGFAVSNTPQCPPPEMMRLQIKLQASYSDSLKTELERIKFKLSKIAGFKTGAPNVNFRKISVRKTI